MTELPDPLTPPDCDLRDFGFMPVDIIRLFGSRFHAIADDSEWRAGLTLWLKSFHQVPAASVPDDDIELTRLAELGRDTKTWRRVREVALHGWVKCSDGRLYHPVVAEKALEAHKRKEFYRERSKKANEARWSGDRAGDESSSHGGKPKDANRVPRRNAKEVQNASNAQPLSNASRNASSNPSASQGTVIGTGTEPPAPSLSPNPQLVAVMKAGGFVSPPSDAGLIREWLEIGADFDRDVLPTVTRIAEQEMGRTGRAPFKLKLFDAAIRQKVAEDDAEVERFKQIAARNQRLAAQ